ncbi:MAG: class I SAM-dependent methyltransferase [Gemmataceae bacterium]
MAIAQLSTTDRAMQRCRAFVQMLLGGYQPRDFAIRFWDGSTWEPDLGQPATCTLVLHHPGSLRRMFWPPDRLSLMESYIFDEFDVEGEMLGFCRILKYIHGLVKSWGWCDKLRVLAQIYRLPKLERSRTTLLTTDMADEQRSIQHDKKSIAYHYDLSNDFYALWLDRQMVYTCAYFHTPDDDIDTAQLQKIDYVCRKLRLKPGERMLDVGCGWGGLTLHAAKHYGANVLGITLSQEQVKLANERIREAGLADRARVEYRDYRELQDPAGFDKIAAIGIIEHVGEANMPAYYQQAWNLLKPGGVFLSHGIALKGDGKMPRKPNFALKYVFPNGELITLHTNLRAAEKTGFEVRDVENLREHYIRTLRHWRRALDAHADEARRITNDVRYRIYRLYLAGSEFGFTTGMFNLYQTLLAKPDAHGATHLPLERKDWYE